MAVIYDIEVCPDAWLIMFKDTRTGEYFWVWSYDETESRIGNLECVADSGETFVGFNNHGFDEPLWSAMIEGRSPREIKHIGDGIIKDRLFPYKTYRKFGLEKLDIDSVDLMSVAPSFVSLKCYGARMAMPTVQDLPFDHTVCWTPDMLDDVLQYCKNDLDTTEALFDELNGPLDIRQVMGREYHIDMRSLSDTQMAEKGFIKRLNLEYGRTKVPHSIDYNPPDFLKEIRDGDLRELYESMRTHEYDMNRNTGHVILPKGMGAARKMLGGTYRTGVGGLHSQHDRKVCFVACDDFELYEIDAASFYPSIIINAEAGDAAFIKEYRSIYDRRMIAKKAGDTAVNETLKISLNGTFGKTAAKHSPLYDPEVMLHVTLTGQLTLLALIERVIAAGGAVVSGNTDGIVAAVKVGDTAVRKAVEEFEKLTGFVFEWTQYRAIAFKDVNNYFAVKTDRSVKRKGLYTPTSLKKNPTVQVCADAVAEWLAHGTPFRDTVDDAPFENFLAARNVTGGASQGEKVLGKVVRWYQCDEEVEAIRYVKNGNLVPKTTGGKECMVLPLAGEYPNDLDYDWYVNEARRIAIDVGCERFLEDIGEESE